MNRNREYRLVVHNDDGRKVHSCIECFITCGSIVSVGNKGPFGRLLCCKHKAVNISVSEKKRAADVM